MAFIRLGIASANRVGFIVVDVLDSSTQSPGGTANHLNEVSPFLTNCYTYVVVVVNGSRTVLDLKRNSDLELCDTFMTERF